MTAGEFRAGSIFKMDNKFYQVVESLHVSQPRMAAFVRAKIKNVENGAVQEKRFNVGDYFPEVDFVRKDLLFSYEDGNIVHFVDGETWEETIVDKTLAQDALKYNQEGIAFTFTSVDGKIISIAPPTFVVLTVTQTDPSTAGDTVKNALKPATMETGININVPMFVNSGDKIKVDTRDGSYVSRV
ncbi:MAG: elongation factor P [Clostridiales bacterium]|jgi:elongation factor P|nr:elongation factor P [Clostridiales bacterium]